MIYTKNKPMPLLIKSAVSTAAIVIMKVVNIFYSLSMFKPRTGKVSSLFKLWITCNKYHSNRQQLKGT